jgi:oligoribonuclease
MYLWLDLETTGLQPTVDRIIEAAWIPSHTSMFTARNQIEESVINPGILGWDLINASQFITDMHEKTGLLDDIRQGSYSELAEVELRIMETMAEWENEHVGCFDDPIWYLAGASVHFDLAFLRVHIPNLAARLSHRVFDTSTLKAFMAPFLAIPDSFVNENQHRAAHDVLEVITVARYYWENMVEATDIMRQVERELELQQIIEEEITD